ncbi:MAG: hypothetical protein SPL94_08660 [Oribacterium sp.]|nr:hypothetical protein [Oribacterium sp.]
MPGCLVGDGPEAADKKQPRIRVFVPEIIVQLLRIDGGGAGDRPLLKPPVLRADVDQLAALGEGLLHEAQRHPDPVSGGQREGSSLMVLFSYRWFSWGLPAALAMTWVIWRINIEAIHRSFYVPWYSIAIAVGSVFLVVFVTMLYAMDKIKKDNTIDALKNENL